jgi:hypothetical protein
LEWPIQLPSVTLGDRSYSVSQSALGGFRWQDNFKWAAENSRSSSAFVTEWNMDAD